MIVVHVIGPHLSDRHEFHYADGTPDDAILADMKTPDNRGVTKADIIGRVKVRGTNPETGKLGIISTDVWVIDHPETVICVGELYWEGGKKLFRETRRLKGPAT